MQVLLSYIRTTLLIITIAFLSLMNVNKVVPENIHFFKHFDKFAHFCMYFALSFVFLIENHCRKKQVRKRWIIFDTLAVGILLEVLQFCLTSHRSANIYDAIFNSLGVCFGTALFLSIRNMPFFYKLLLLKFPQSK